jgi:hypothetical protein
MVTRSCKSLARKAKRALTARHRHTPRGNATETLSAAPATITLADATRLADATASLSTSAQAQIVAGSCCTNRDAKVLRQVAPLATWKDEGGATARV